MVSDQQVQRRLIVGLALYEGLVIFAVAAAGIDIATRDGSPLIAATPVVVVAASEALRVPLSAWATRLTIGNRLLAIAVLGCLAVASAEGLALSFDNLIAARTKNVSSAAKQVDVAKGELAQAESKLAPISAALTQAVHEIEALDTKHKALIATPPTPPGFSGTTCRSRKGNVYGCPADAAAQKTFAATRADYNRQIKALEDERKTVSSRVVTLQGQVEANGVASAQSSVALATRDYTDALEASPMHRIAASWFGVRAVDLTEQQFSVFRKYAVTGLSVALASMSALVAWLAFQPARADKPSKLERALRACVARHRKRVVREVPVPSGVRVINKYIPIIGAADAERTARPSKSLGPFRVYPELFKNAD